MNNGAILRTRRRSPLPNACKLSGRYCRAFARETTLHCLKYVGDTKLTLAERCYFLIWFVVLVAIAINFTTNVFVTWSSTPVIVGAQSSYTNLLDEPFPAITICNMNQAEKSKATNISVDSLQYAMLQKTCLRDFNYSAYSHLQNSRSEAFSAFQLRIAQPCDKMLAYCRYGGEKVQCAKFFREMLLDDGLCCVFNVLHPQFLYKGKYNAMHDIMKADDRIPVDWSPETGYQKNLPRTYNPRKMVGAGESKGLTLLLNADINEYYCSSANAAGFKVTLHNPIDIPNMRDTGLPVAIGYETRFKVTVTSFTSLPNIRSVSPLQRHCLFNNELRLNHYKHYSRRNCENECDAAYMLRQCKCIPHYMPPLFANSTVCHVSDFDCLQKAEKQGSDSLNVDCKAKCIPACNNIFYFPTPYIYRNTIHDYEGKNKYFRNISQGDKHENLAILRIYFETEFYRKSVKSRHNSFTEYLSQTGGIMSLMVGFGLISLAEIFYFGLMRPIFDRRLSRPPFGPANPAPNAVTLPPGKVLVINNGKRFDKRKFNGFSYKDHIEGDW